MERAGGVRGGEIDVRDARSVTDTLRGRLGTDAWSRLVYTAMVRHDEAVVLSTGDDPTSPERAVVAYANAGFTVLTSYRADEVLGQSWHLWAPSACNRTVFGHFRAALQAGRPVRGRVRIVTKGGVARVAETSVIPVHDVDGVHFMTTMRDGDHPAHAPCDRG